MKKILILLLCMIYTFVTFGGSIFVHTCGENILMSIYEESSHNSCPICNKEHQQKDNCAHNSCEDREIKIDQLSDELFSSNQGNIFILQPAILNRLWVTLKPVITITSTPKSTIEDTKDYYTNSSPPVYIINRNIRN